MNANNEKIDTGGKIYNFFKNIFNVSRDNNSSTVDVNGAVKPNVSDAAAVNNGQEKSQGAVDEQQQSARKARGIADVAALVGSIGTVGLCYNNIIQDELSNTFDLTKSNVAKGFELALDNASTFLSSNPGIALGIGAASAVIGVTIMTALKLNLQRQEQSNNRVNASSIS